MTHDEAIGSSKRGVYVALSLTVVAAILLALGYMFFDGAALMTQLFNGGKDDVAVAPVTPAPPAAPSEDATEPAGQSTESTESAAATETAETPAEDDSSDSGTTGFTNTTTKPPTGDQTARMYWEQVASQEMIGNLVRGDITSVNIGSVTKSGNTASVRLTVSSKSLGSVSGTMILRDYSGVWYFSSITRDGSTGGSTSSKPGDPGIVSTLVSQQANNQAIVTGIINGGYKKFSISGVSGGSGTATVRFTASGGTSASTSGSIVCVSKVLSGTKYWFVTSFTKN